MNKNDRTKRNKTFIMFIFYCSYQYLALGHH